MASAGHMKALGRNRKRPVHVNESSPVIKAFRCYQTELDSKHDRYERIVKLSRDITIDSKRVIFLLQRCAGDETEEKQTVLEEAQSKLKEIQHTKFLPVAVELEGQDHYQFIRAYSPGLQEYIEAVSFYHYLSGGQLVTLSEVERDLKFSHPTAADIAGPPAAGMESPAPGMGVSSTSGPCNDAPASDTPQKGDRSVSAVDTAEISSTSDAAGNDGEKTQTTSRGDMIAVTVPPMEFMLGIADLTGELMRTAIMSVSAGNLNFPVQICEFMRIIHDAFMSYGNTARELTRKMTTLRQSLQKVENACYTLKVRGSEIPKHMLATIFSAAPSDASFAEDAEDSTYD